MPRPAITAGTYPVPLKDPRSGRGQRFARRSKFGSLQPARCRPRGRWWTRCAYPPYKTCFTVGWIRRAARCYGPATAVARAASTMGHAIPRQIWNCWRFAYTVTRSMGPNRWVANALPLILLVMNKELGRSATEKGAKGNTDWQTLRALPDPEVNFTEDAPATSPEDWANAIARKGPPVPSRKTQIALRIDDDVLEWFKA